MKHEETTLAAFREMKYRAETLADILDPRRTRTARDEATRTAIKSLDTIATQCSKAINLIEVSTKRKRT